MVGVLLGVHGEAAGRDASRFTADVLPALVDRCGDSNQRTSKTAIETIVAVASIHGAGLATHTHLLVRCAAQDASAVLDGSPPLPLQITFFHNLRGCPASGNSCV